MQLNTGTLLVANRLLSVDGTGATLLQPTVETHRMKQVQTRCKSPLVFYLFVANWTLLVEDTGQG